MREIAVEKSRNLDFALLIRAPLAEFRDFISNLWESRVIDLGIEFHFRIFERAGGKKGPLQHRRTYRTPSTIRSLHNKNYLASMIGPSSSR